MYTQWLCRKVTACIENGIGLLLVTILRINKNHCVQKFMKVLTYQELDEVANLTFSAAGSRISRTEGMEGHARACDWRLRKFYPNIEWDFPVYDQKRYD